jgi:hypothetical protein
VEAVKAGRSVYFATLADVVSSLAKAEREGILRERIRFLCRPQLLIIDAIGYLPVIAGGGNLVFQLVKHRPTHYVREFRSDRMDPGERTAPSLAWTGCSYSAAVAT